jgi:hypothetical protein
MLELMYTSYLVGVNEEELYGNEEEEAQLGDQGTSTVNQWP